jgi:hypothetical protein
MWRVLADSLLQRTYTPTVGRTLNEHSVYFPLHIPWAASLDLASLRLYVQTPLDPLTGTYIFLFVLSRRIHRHEAAMYVWLPWVLQRGEPLHLCRYVSQYMERACKRVARLARCAAPKAA